MRKYIFILLIGLAASLSHAQEQNTLLTMTIVKATINGVDVSETYKYNQQRLVLYKQGDKLLFGNVSEIKDLQSFGEITNLKIQKKPETKKVLKHDILSFDWYYANSYDANVGMARVKITIIYKPNSTLFLCNMTLENNEKSEYIGTAEGTEKNKEIMVTFL